VSETRDRIPDIRWKDVIATAPNPWVLRC
jgi:hypothetical protein